MTYTEAIHYIEGISGLGAKLGLDRIKALLSWLGDPQDSLQVIHVAGTNGKGSACAMLSSVLMEAGYHVGVYTSPHLESYRERFTIDGEMISEEEFSGILSELVLEIKKHSPALQPTVFELLTVMAFSFFCRKKVDYVILEVGLGGRYDATNVIGKPIMSLIMSIGFDHMDYLGDTVLEIAAEKAGIIKEGRPVVLYTQENGAFEVVQEAAKKKNAPLYYALQNKFCVRRQNLDETVFSVKNEWISYENVCIHLMGEYQLKNCATVLLACRALQDLGIRLTEAQILSGMKRARWNGRMEIVSKDPLIILDGAHNADGIAMLAASIRKYFSKKKITLLVGVLGDKEYAKMTDLLIPLVSRVVVTEPANARALPAKKLAKIVLPYQKPVFVENDRKEALLLAKKLTAYDEVLLCAGSLYLIGELRKILVS